jgi:hypothetical protein
MSAPPDPGETRMPVHVCAGPGVLGRHGDLEGTFRRFLDVIVQPRDSILPPLLWEYVADHRYRTDDTGRTLCFAGPLREDMLDLLMAWLQSTKQKPMRRGAHTTPRHAEQLRLLL